MKKIIFLMLAVLFACQTAFAAKAAIMKPLGEVDIYSLSDFRGHITETESNPGALRLSGVLESLAKQNPYGTAFLGGANNMSGTPENDQRLGDPTILMLNSMGIAATVLGAQDFTYEAHKITNQVATSYFAYLGANVLNADGKVAAPFKPYLLFNRGGANIGVVGLLGGQAAAAAQARGYRVVPAAQVAQQCVDELRHNGAGIVILLTSLQAAGEGDGMVTGEVTGLLDQVTGVDGVFVTGGDAAVKGTYNKVPVAAGAPNGTDLGNLHFLYNRIDKKVLVGVAKTVATMTLPSEPDKKLEKTYARLMGGGRLATMSPSDYAAKPEKKKSKTSIYQNINGSVPQPQPAKKGEHLADSLVSLTNYPGGQSTLGEYFTDLLRKAYNADIVLYPGSSFQYSIPVGAINEGTLQSVLPYQDEIITGELTGAQIKAILEHGLNAGAGLVRFSGIKVQAHLTAPEGARVGSVKLDNGNSLQNNQVYKVLVSSRMQQGAEGYNLSYLANAANKGRQMDFFKFALRYAKTINYTGDDRLRF